MISLLLFSLVNYRCTVATPNIAQCSNAGPVVATAPGDRQVTLTWLSVGSSQYEVYRTSLVGCRQGKVLLGTTTLLTFTDSGLQNGQQYYYEVIPKGSNGCFGPTSGCVKIWNWLQYILLLLE